MYTNELNAIKKSNRFRSRELFADDVIDLASNDYLGLAENKELLELACDEIKRYKFHSPKASMLVNGYHEIHKNFETALCEANNIESGVIVGSGFLANISLIEALVRKDDVLFIDEEYHASGILATRFHNRKQIMVFKHNDFEDLEQKIASCDAIGRKLVAIEGIYSMSGDIAKKEIFEISDAFGALLIVDEAHSSGIIGDNLMGIFDFYKIQPKQNHIKMGTLGKAYGSYGAYILGSKEIISYLENRAKPIIYSTAPSLFDTLLGHKALEFILQNNRSLKSQIDSKKNYFDQKLNIKKEGLIFPIEIGNNKMVLKIKQKLKDEGFLIGGIRQPTVKNPILRIIGRINIDNSSLDKLIFGINKEISSV